MYKFIVLATIFGIGIQIPTDVASPSVNGIQLNDSTETVLLALGNPISQDTHSYNDCNPETNNLQWDYPGLSITFTQQDQHPTVSKITIDQGNWELNGIQLNDNVQRVKNLFGEADFIHDVLPYNNRGNASWEFTVRNNLVTNISLKQTTCNVT